MVNGYEQEHIRTVVQPPRPVGRPAVDIPENQLRFLVEHNFKTTDIAQLFLPYNCEETKRIWY